MIVAHPVYPPIPVRDFDWCAYDSATYDGEMSAVGHGPTREAAIADYEEQAHGR